MAKKRRTELDIDRDFLAQEQAPPPPPKPEEAPPPQPPPPEKRRKKINKLKLLMVIGAASVAVSLTAAVGWLALSFFKSMTSSHEKAKPQAAPAPPKPKTAVAAPIYALQPFFIPLKEKDSGEGRFARIQFALEMNSPDVQRDIDRNITLVRENVYFMLQGREKAEFASREKLNKLVIDVAIAVNRSLQSGGVTRVWITEILIS